MTPQELITEVAKRMDTTSKSIIALKGQKLSEDYVQGYCQAGLDWLETLQTILAEQN